ncbi:LHFPL tetraspan subfamily member 4 protein-like protein [Lates japonicus]|uniref:LHFPL tetraspan subfamily member 4 protein-like protein n=1 Tax=Lates japonicus TaxID=270547 RepID=A0AAD3QW20_LATJO|nr:LHFPL tetraspan subfamily member 4 protein-like protein [Lates japonicus]
MLPFSKPQIYHDNYIRNSRAIGYCEPSSPSASPSSTSVFIQPYWIGDSVNTPQAGYFGLFHYYVGTGPSPSRAFTCVGSFSDFSCRPERQRRPRYSCCCPWCDPQLHRLHGALLLLQHLHRLQNLRLDAAAVWWHS